MATELPPVPTTAPPEILEFNRRIEEWARDKPKAWEVGPVALRRGREEGTSVFGPIVRSERAEDHIADTNLGPIGIRVIHPQDEARGIFVHIHGGGFVVGSNHHHDPMLERLADATRLTVASVNYRLAPEDPYPAGPDDCEAGTRWLIDNSTDRLGSDVVAIGGESAGASLAVVTMLRLRDRHGLMPFRVALLPYGLYDHRHTPSVRFYGERPLVLDTPLCEWFTNQYLDDVRRDDPDVSPIFADLQGLPPALFVVGDTDPLLDDTLFMAARWKAAGNETELEVWPGAPHAWDYFDTDYAHAARARMHAFVNRML
jgi:acetyl esterase/lipase